MLQALQLVVFRGAALPPTPPRWQAFNILVI